MSNYTPTILKLSYIDEICDYIIISKNKDSNNRLIDIDEDSIIFSYYNAYDSLLFTRFLSQSKAGEYIIHTRYPKSIKNYAVKPRVELLEELQKLNKLYIRTDNINKL